MLFTPAPHGARRRAGGSPHRGLVRDYAENLRLYPTRASKVGLVVMLATWLTVPMVLASSFWLSVLIYSGIVAIGAIGLNLLTGYCGQISLGHAFFIALGAYTVGVVGGGNLGFPQLPLPVWLLAAGLIGALIGALVGPFALRLRGFYLAIVTLGLLFVGDQVWRNWRGLTGAGSGTSVRAPAAVGPMDFNQLEIFGVVWTRNQGWFWLVWGLVLLTALLAKNLTRSRPGRAMQAVRDGDLQAAVIGVSTGRYKIGAFAVSSGLAGVAGALFGAYQQFVHPDEWTLLLSVQYIAVIIIGGLGTVFGAVIGALFLGAVPHLIDRYSDVIPGVAHGVGQEGFISIFALNQVLFGVLIVLFLIFEPHGLAGIWLRIKAYVKTWPFSY